MEAEGLDSRGATPLLSLKERIVDQVDLGMKRISERENKTYQKA